MFLSFFSFFLFFLLPLKSRRSLIKVSDLILSISFFLFIPFSNTVFAHGQNAYSSIIPTEEKQIIKKQEKQKKQKKQNIVKVQSTPSLLPDSFKKDYEFIFFYSVSCPHCKSFAPVLRQYADKTGIIVQVFALGKGSLEYFPNSIVATQEIIDKFFIFNKDQRLLVPVLFLLNKNNLHAYPVSQGSLTYFELHTRMNELIPKIASYDKINEIK